MYGYVHVSKFVMVNEWVNVCNGWIHVTWLNTWQWCAWPKKTNFLKFICSRIFTLLNPRPRTTSLLRPLLLNFWVGHKRGVPLYSVLYHTHPIHVWQIRYHLFYFHMEFVWWWWWWWWQFIEHEYIHAATACSLRFSGFSQNFQVGFFSYAV